MRYNFNLTDDPQCQDPEDCDCYIVKRVTALAGQFVELDPHEEQGAYVARHSYEGKLSVPSGYCWVEGDNRSTSHDSRAFGPIPLGLVKGRALCRIFPWPMKILLKSKQTI